MFSCTIVLPWESMTAHDNGLFQLIAKTEGLRRAKFNM